MPPVNGHSRGTVPAAQVPATSAPAGEKLGFFRDYAARHTNGWNRVLHLIGVPIAPVLFLYFLVRGRFAWALAAFAVGYTLQWIGHRIEGNGMADSLEGRLVALVLAPFRRSGADA